MLTKTAIAVIAAVALGACSAPYAPTPLATNFPTTKQETLQAAAHWGVIGNHIEQQVIAELKKSSPRPLYVASPAKPTPFQQALTAQLISSLVKDGYVVSRSPAGALQLSLDIQALTFAPDRKKNLPIGVPTALATGVWLVNEHNPFTSSAGKVAIDAYNWYDSEYTAGPTPSTELIITASVTDQYRYYVRATNTYYVADADRALYGIDEDPRMPRSTQILVKGDR
jgi:hypothetical protein